MGTAGLIWREVAEGEDDERYGSPEQPEFHDAARWADWLTATMSFEGSEEDLRDVGCGALAEIYVSDMDAANMTWTSPEAVLAAADRLGQLIRSESPTVEAILAAYEELCEDGEAAGDLILAELEMAKAMALWARAIGKSEIAFEIG
jgi:hypothetical protein